MKYLLLCLFSIPLLVFSQEKSQDSLSGFSVTIDGGYLLGGQISGNDFLYHSGLSGRLIGSKKLTQNFTLGIGAGIDQYDEFRFTSAVLRINYNQKLHTPGSFIAYAGYSFSNEGNSGGVLFQDFEEGLTLEVGRMWTYRISPKLDFTSSLTFRHQFSELKLESPSGTILREKVDFDSINLRIGINVNL